MKNYKPKETVLLITVFLVVLYMLFRKEGFLYAALALGITGIISLYISEKIDWVWSQLSQAMATASNYILLTIIFLFVVTPIAALRRLFGKNNFWRIQKDKESNFSDRNHTYITIDMERVW